MRVYLRILANPGTDKVAELEVEASGQTQAIELALVASAQRDESLRQAIIDAGMKLKTQSMMARKLQEMVPESNLRELQDCLVDPDGYRKRRDQMEKLGEALANSPLGELFHSFAIGKVNL